MRKKDKISEEYQISLSEIQKCKVLNSTRAVKTKDGNYSVIDKLALVFNYKDRNRPETVLECYNAESRVNLTGELKLTEKWAKIINIALSEINANKATNKTSASTVRPIDVKPAFA